MLGMKKLDAAALQAAAAGVTTSSE
jgi:hypothetical protein